MPGNAIRRSRLRCITVILSVVLAAAVLGGACGSDNDTGPVRPVRLPPTTVAEGEPPPSIQEPPRPVEPLPPPEAEQP